MDLMTPRDIARVGLPPRRRHIDRTGSLLFRTERKEVLMRKFFRNMVLGGVMTLVGFGGANAFAKGPGSGKGHKGAHKLSIKKNVTPVI